MLHWRYGDQLDWRLVTIGLAEDPQRYIDAGYTPTRSTIGQQSYFRRFGMPLLMEPRDRVTATARACRAIVATRLLFPGREHEVLRALQLGWFTTTLLLDQDADIAQALARVDGARRRRRASARSTSRATLAAYEDDKQQTRSAEGGPTEFQGKARQTDGPVRYSAPSLVFHSSAGAAPGGRRLSDDRRLRRADRQPRFHARAPGAARSGDRRAAALSPMGSSPRRSRDAWPRTTRRPTATPPSAR